MTSHTLEQRKFIARRLGRCDLIRVILDAFQATYPDTACTEFDVRATDPTVVLLPPPIVQAFIEGQQSVKDGELEDVARYANRNLRICALSNLADWYLKNNQPRDARDTLKQIADELGVGKSSTKGTVKVDEPTGPIEFSFALDRANGTNN